MKKQIFITLTAVLLLGIGIGAFLYASSQKSTNSTVSQSTERETVFKVTPEDARYDPEQNQCTAYAWLGVGIAYHNFNEEIYIVTTSSDTPYSNDYRFHLAETMEGELLDCVECQYRCSAYYALCDKYNVTPEDTPVP